ncbi:MAG: TRAP-type uncharacterized transport system, periplasmic component [Gemmatimonadetes bacterium]|nr:TRAP-type uncharacterized transport system, periplasmic component [Gemmatimonadota bacterium]
MEQKPLAPRAFRRPRLLWFLGVLALLGTLVLGVRLFHPPQRRLVMAAGPLGSSAYWFAQRYREIVGREGVVLDVVATRGMLENLARLQDPSSGVDVALLEGGTTSPEDSPELVSLGTVYYRPIWVFHRGRMPLPGQAWPAGFRIALGPEGDNPADLSRRLLAEGGVNFDSVRIMMLEPDAAADSLLEGKADMAAIVSAWEAPVLKRLILADGIQLAGFLRADARVARHPELTRLVLPEGVADLARNIPPADVQLVAPTVSLAARSSLHSALQYLLLESAAEVHGRAGLFEAAGHFPAAEPGDLPLSRAARSYYKSGTPFLQRHLPFWVAAVLTQIGVLLIPVFGLAYPLLRGAPALYSSVMHRRVSRVYGDLKLLELEMAEGQAGSSAEVLARLDALDVRAARVQTTMGFAPMVYTLRQHIQLIRDRLARAQAPR